MPISPEMRKRLYEFMDERRKDLLLSWRDVASRGGLSYEALRGIPGGSGGLRSLTKRRIEVGLEWPPGTVDQIIEGGKPELDQGGAAPADSPPLILEYWNAPDRNLREAVRKIGSLTVFDPSVRAGMLSLILEELAAKQQQPVRRRA